MVIGDPLDSLGIKGVGSPEDTREFMELLTLVGLRRDVAFLLLHHPRKGDSDDELDEVSGAWGGRPDSLLKLDKLDGNRARLSFPKVRWSRQGNRSPLILAFEPETEAFEAVGEEQEEERDYVAEIEELLADGSWMTVSGIASRKQAKDEPKAGIGAREQAVRQALDEHPERFERRTGEAAKVLGRHSNAHLWGVLPGSGAHGSTQLSLRPTSASASAPAPIGEQTQGADVDGVIPEAGSDDG